MTPCRESSAGDLMKRLGQRYVQYAVCQSDVPTEWDTVGGAFSFVFDRGGRICLGMLSVHRAQSGTGKNGRASRGADKTDAQCELGHP